MSEDRQTGFEALVAAEERFHQLFRSIRDGVAIYEPVEDGADFVFVDINPAGELLTKVTRGEVVGQRLTKVFPGVEEMGLLEVLRRVHATNQPESLALRRYRDGRIDRQLENQVLRLPAGLLVAIFNDTSEQSRAQEALRRSEGHFRELIDASPIAIAVLDGEGRVTSLNRRFVAKFGYTPQDLPSLDAWWQLAYPDPAYRALVQQAWAEAELRAATHGEDISVGREASITCKDGRVRQVEVIGSWIDDQQIITLRDRTGQLAAEAALREREEQLRLAQKMEAVGRLAGGVAHDFNNLLTGIIGNIALARMELPEGHALLSIFDEIEIVARRTSNLVRQLLNFSRGELLRPRPLALDELLAQTARMLQGLLGADIELLLELAPELRPVLADRTQLEQVLVNLAVNARDAMPRGGRLTISTELRSFDHRWAGANSLIAGDYACLRIEDTGDGMDAETREHLFEPFFTTKDAQHGSGLGLATVYAIVERHGGRIEVSSAPQQGTTFRIYLPLARRDARRVADTAELEAATEAVVGGSETILLVEDEALVRDMARRALEHKGYQVHAVGHAAAALAVLAASTTAPDLLVTDVVMPGMNGRELADQVRRQFPQLPVLFISGYSTAVLSRYGALPGPGEDVALLAKPFEPDELAHRVRKLLDEHAAARRDG